MTWNYRVVRCEYPNAAMPEDAVLFEIHEAFYTDYVCYATTVDAVAPVGSTLTELRETLERMLRALDAPVLDYETRENRPEPEQTV